MSNTEYIYVLTRFARPLHLCNTLDGIYNYLKTYTESREFALEMLYVNPEHTIELLLVEVDMYSTHGIPWKEQQQMLTVQVDLLITYYRDNNLCKDKRTAWFNIHQNVCVYL